MAEQELVTRSFRVTDETAKKIKDIATEIDGNQQAAFAKLIEVYEWQKTKENYPEKEGVLTEFEGYTSALIRLFQTAVGESIQARTLAYTDFASEMARKDTIIVDMQDKVSKAEKALNERDKELRELQEQMDIVKENYNLVKVQYDSLKKKADKDADKLEMTEKAVAQLTDKHLKATTKEIDMSREIEELKSAATVSKESIADLQRILKEKERYINELEEYKQHQSEREQDIKESITISITEELRVSYEAAALAKDKAHMEQIKQITEENQKEMKELQKQYMELVQKITQ